MKEKGWDARGGAARLSDESGLAQGQISGIKNSKRIDNVTVALVVRLADALEVNRAWLLTGEGPMKGDWGAAPVLAEGTPEFDAVVNAAVKKMQST